MAASQSLYSKNHQLLLQLMNKASIASMKELSKISGIPELQLIRLEHGLLPKMQIETLLKLSKALQISVDKLLALFCSESLPPATIDLAESVALDTLKQEYQNLQQTLAQQQETLEQQFQQESIQRIESWLLQWPTAAAVAQQNPQFSAAKILPLAKP
ncbi:MAG: helix-turn-helix transcriptional regulator, partial [Hydrococcus sp. RM1_1_31]|nr:helix-turn-helix transcriptional regulator [Hydrococcus sp. RM1_1_31]